MFANAQMALKNIIHGLDFMIAMSIQGNAIIKKYLLKSPAKNVPKTHMHSERRREKNTVSAENGKTHNEEGFLQNNLLEKEFVPCACHPLLIFALIVKPS